MKVPVSWLREYVEFDGSVEELAEKLTFSGIEVEGIETSGADCSGIVVGEVKTIKPHPGADRLLLCRVDNGTEEISVVCGAHNFEVGDKVPFVGVGKKLPGGMKIKKARIRGEESCGMICSEQELELSDEHDGIMVLDRSLPVGMPFSDVVGRPDTVLDLEVTWNRPDCLSIIGIAREVAALFGSRLKLPSVDFPEKGEAADSFVSASIEDPEGCPRYTARFLSGVRIGPSPAWMQKRLLLCGVRAINNIVDITNYVMLECGQPLHAFDYKLLADQKIIVRRARPGEKMVTLDGVQRVITPDMLMIADAGRPVAAAGIMGGMGSEIGDETDKVLLESACFSAPGIKKTSSSLNLTSESSYRFERGVDISQVDWASRRATGLMVEYAGATAAKGVVDVFPCRPEEKKITCRFNRVRGLLGVKIEDDKITSILESLEIKVTGRDENGCEFSVPTFRPDLQLEADLIEEVARVYGLNNIPEALPRSHVVSAADDKTSRAVEECRKNCIGLGMMEIMNYSFVGNQFLDMFHADDLGRVVLPNPVSAEQGVLRNSLIPQMMETIGRNFSRQIAEVAFFEIGRVFWSENGAICEEDRISIGLAGRIGRSGLGIRQVVRRDEMFLWLKGVVEALMLAQHVGRVEVVKKEQPFFEKGFSVDINVDGGNFGVMGLMDGGICGHWRIMGPVGIVEFRLKPLILNTFAAPRYQADTNIPGHNAGYIDAC